MRHHGSSMRHPDHLKTTLPGRVRVRSDYRRKMTQYTDVTKLASSSPAGRAPARVRERSTVHLRGPPGSWKLERAVSYTWEHAVQNAHQTAIEDRDTSHYTEYDVVFTIARVVPTGRPRRADPFLFLLRSMRPPPVVEYTSIKNHPCTSQRPCGHRLGSPLRLADHGHAKPRYSRAGGSARLCPLSHTYSSPASAAHHATDNPPPCQGIPPRVAAPHLARSAYVRTT